MKRWRKFLSLLVIIFILTGCSSNRSQCSVASSLVKQATITCESCDVFSRRDYTSPEKLRLILLCIRRLGPDFPPKVDAQALEGKTLRITLTCADGSLVTYRIKNNQYLRKNDGPWRQINADSASGFYQLIMMLPSDEDADRSMAPKNRGIAPFFPGFSTFQK